MKRYSEIEPPAVAMDYNSGMVESINGEWVEFKDVERLLHMVKLLLDDHQTFIELLESQSNMSLTENKKFLNIIKSLLSEEGV